MSGVPEDVARRVAPWSGVAYVHIQPNGNERLDVESMSRQPRGRWNRPEQPTLYFAGDPGVALSELARHLPPDEQGASRDLIRVELEFAGVLDVRAPEVCERIGVPDAPFCLLQRSNAQGLASRLRARGDIEALVVPPMAFLEQPDRWNLVVFFDRLGDGWLRNWARIGTLEVRPVGE